MCLFLGLFAFSFAMCPASIIIYLCHNFILILLSASETIQFPHWDALVSVH